MTAEYGYGGRSPGTTIQFRQYFTDGHGDVTALADEDGYFCKFYAYDAFGNLISGSVTGSNRFLYASEYYDTEPGTYYLRARYYEPRTGVFLTEDPARDGLNWYSYCAANPVNYVDPTGEFIISVTALCMIGGALLFGTIGGLIGNQYANQKGATGWEKAGSIVLGALVGGVFGAALGAAIAPAIVSVTGVTEIAITASGISTIAVESGTTAIVEKVPDLVVNKSPQSWQEAEQIVRDAYSAKKTFFEILDPDLGNRIVDAFNFNAKTIHEVKYGAKVGADFIKKQIAKDIWLRNNNPNVEKIVWHFFQSVETGLIGPNHSLTELLENAGIKIIIHNID